MSESIKIQDFSAGWIPSDSALGGRKNGLLRMTGVTLNENGALTLANGTKKGSFVYPANAHTLFCKFFCDSSKNYLALEDGSVYRDSTLIASGGSSLRAAFGVYGDFVLIFSGGLRYKDGCDGLISLIGLISPQMPLTINLLKSAFFTDADILGDLTRWTHNYPGYGGTFIANSVGSFTVDIFWRC